jgi:alkanesulfonate monooxygenase SsuD/methylene tetrahydromethanopterin reductase-like flavin-dependent oxidoreductase (luciferase family)
VNVPVYRAFHEWLGRTDALAGHWERWAEGDRKGSLAEIPDSVVDELIVHGSPAECRAHIHRYFDNGVTTASISIMGFGGLDTHQAIRDLAPAAG